MGIHIGISRGSYRTLNCDPKQIDPHFTDDEGFISPVARFIPTDVGMALARTFAKHI